MRVLDLHHVQIAMPRGAEEELRAWYGGVVGLAELPKPAVLAARGGVWFALGERELHCGVEDDFQPARKAHPCLVVDDIDALARAVAAAGGEVRWGAEIPVAGLGARRFHTDDPVGNRVEFHQA